MNLVMKADKITKKADINLMSDKIIPISRTANVSSSSIHNSFAQ
jgi:hypothetical protein